MKNLIDRIRGASSFILSTHRESDGDGLGAQLALYHALKKLGREVRLLNVDPIPQRYYFLDPGHLVQTFEGVHDPIQKTDLAMIFDTNDCRLVEPLYSELVKTTDQIIFIDHHPVLKSGPSPTKGSFIETAAASTGEIVYNIIKELGIPLDLNIAKSLYTSIAFDTQIFRYIRNSPKSHLIAAELLGYGVSPQEIHQNLFGHHTIEKISFLALALSNVEYFNGGKLAFLKIRESDMKDFGLGIDATKDVIDMIMNISILEIAVLVREDRQEAFKISFRSKGKFPVIAAAEALGGGGHVNAAGAYYHGPYKELKEKILDTFREQMKAS